MHVADGERRAQSRCVLWFFDGLASQKAAAAPVKQERRPTFCRVGPIFDICKKVKIFYFLCSVSV